LIPSCLIGFNEDIVESALDGFIEADILPLNYSRFVNHYSGGQIGQCSSKTPLACAIYNNAWMLHLSSLASTVNWHWVWLVVAAFLAGVLNAVAGGGSFLLFPAMLSMGMLPILANASNAVALWPGQFTSIAGYREDVRKNLRLAGLMGFAGLIGGGVGAVVLLRTPQLTFLHMVPWLLLVAALIFALSGPVTRWLARKNLSGPADSLKQNPSNSAHWTIVKGVIFLRKMTLNGRAVGYIYSDSAVAASAESFTGARAPRLVPLWIATVVVSFYIGYFGAGAGFLIMTALSLFGFQDLHEINALKVVTSTAANGVAVIIFIVEMQVEWRFCILAMIVGAIGGYSSASLARRVPQPVLRALVVVIGLSMAAWFFWKQ
jgi:hypothetical protein